MRPGTSAAAAATPIHSFPLFAEADKRRKKVSWCPPGNAEIARRSARSISATQPWPVLNILRISPPYRRWSRRIEGAKPVCPLRGTPSEGVLPSGRERLGDPGEEQCHQDRRPDGQERQMDSGQVAQVAEQWRAG